MIEQNEIETGNFALDLINGRLTKATIAEFGARLANQIIEGGEINPLTAYMKLRAIRDAVDLAMKGVKADAMEDAERNAGDPVLHGVKFQVRNGREKWDYSHDPVWAELKASEQATAKMRKEREKFLKTLPQEMVDPSTGEFVEPARLVDVGAPSLALTFPRS